MKADGAYPDWLREASAALDADLVEEVVALREGEIALARPRDSEALIDEDAFAADEALPYWAELWPSGLELARRLSGRALRGARVVELGCGLGLPSLVAAGCGGRVLATDWSAAALRLLERNAAANGLALRTLRVDWARPSELLELAPFDLVLAADVCYERRNTAAPTRAHAQTGPRSLAGRPGTLLHRGLPRACLAPLAARVGGAERGPDPSLAAFGGRSRRSSSPICCAVRGA